MTQDAQRDGGGGRRNRITATEREACPNKAEHYPEPPGLSYTGWDEWARTMSKTHVQRRCPGCNLFVIWVPRGPGVHGAPL
jgi:hypothetical protein